MIQALMLMAIWMLGISSSDSSSGEQPIPTDLERSCENFLLHIKGASEQDGDYCSTVESGTPIP